MDKDRDQRSEVGDRKSIEKLRPKVKQFIAESGKSLRSVALSAGIGASTLSEFLSGKELSRQSQRKLTRAIDPIRQDLDAEALKVSLALKRKFYTQDEIRRIAEKVVRIHNATD